MTEFHHHDHEHPHERPQDHIHVTSRRSFWHVSALTLIGTLLASCGTNGESQPSSASQILTTAEPSVRNAFPGFEAFRDQIQIMSDGNYLRIESSGIPAHNMMVGIRSWQQQVPLPQPYSGSNA